MRHRLALLGGVLTFAAIPVVALVAASSMPATDLSLDASNAPAEADADASADVQVGLRPPDAASVVSRTVRGVTVAQPPPPPPPPTTVPEPEPEEAEPEAPAPAPEPEVAPEAAVAPAPAPAPAPPAARPAPHDPGDDVSAKLDRIAQCESGGNPDAYNPRGYYGAFQFSLSTWQGLGFHGDPRDYTYAEQKYAARVLYNRSGWSPWPHCARELGYL